MYKIGEFAKIVGTTVKTIRYYDEIGLLTPDNIDEFTSYRYYSEENIQEYKLIELLKSVDFSLSEIMKYKDNLDKDVFEYKLQEMKEQMQNLNTKYEKIKQLKSTVENKEDIKILMLRREEKNE